MSSAIPKQVLHDSNNGTPVPDSPSRPPTVCVLYDLPLNHVPTSIANPTPSCGASPGNSPLHLEAARALGRALHENGMNLVYGGGTVGIMGEVAKTLVSLSGPDSVHGIIPAALLRFERSYDENGVALEDGGSAQKLIDEKTFGKTTVVKDMHTRKQMMAREVMEGGAGGGFVALTGGYGTLEELMEIVTWNQLGIHARGVVVYNVDGYWDGLMQWVKKAVESGFISTSNEGIMVEAKEANEVIDCLRGYTNSEGRFKLHWGEK